MIDIKVLKVRKEWIEISGVCQRDKAGINQEMKIIDERKQEIPVHFFDMPWLDRKNAQGVTVSRQRGFSAHLPLREDAKYRFIVYRYRTVDGVKKTKRIRHEISFGRHSRLSQAEHSYIEENGFIIRKRTYSILIRKSTFKRRLACRFRFYKTLRNNGKNDLIALRRKARRDRKRKKKPVVLLADRVNMGRDNAEALFRYMMENGMDADYDIYFCVKKNTEDFLKLSEIGNVLDFGSEEYKRKYLCADWVITAGFDAWFSNAFGEDLKYMADLCSYDHIFLQHGVIMNDWARILNCAETGFSLFITSTDREFEEVSSNRYGYDDGQVVLTGMARYDLLKSEPDKIIAFMPTWRIGLAGDIDYENGSRLYSEKIKGSEYFRFYNSLINDQELLTVMRENGYRGEFYVHPSFMRNASDFEGNDVICVNEKADYSDVFRKAAILVTDYSSVNIDFAYLEKPIVYSQFDRDSFFDAHICRRGYFDYRTDGFGPVFSEIGEVRSELIRLMKNGAEMDEKYRKRAEGFFHFHDRNNRKRIISNIFKK